MEPHRVETLEIPLCTDKFNGLPEPETELSPTNPGEGTPTELRIKLFPPHLVQLLPLVQQTLQRLLLLSLPLLTQTEDDKEQMPHRCCCCRCCDCCCSWCTECRRRRSCLCCRCCSRWNCSCCCSRCSRLLRWCSWCPQCSCCSAQSLGASLQSRTQSHLAGAVAEALAAAAAAGAAAPAAAATPFARACRGCRHAEASSS